VSIVELWKYSQERQIFLARGMRSRLMRGVREESFVSRVSGSRAGGGREDGFG
jgi:hypothetical protein